ncbi:MAG: hypothetical protein JO352_39880 [Chloroflexi bacterium]|nr:hypothetical protein [Chloroflexota bacterium]
MPRVLLLVLSAALFGLSLSQTPPVQIPTQGAPSGAIANVSGPGQSVAQPAAQCPRTTACQYSERTFLPDGYRVQSLQVCGANCTTQYWVSTSTDDRNLITLDPIRGGGVLAVGRSTAGAGQPPVRVVVPSYAANDPACCPSAYADTTYTWDAASNALTAGQPMVTPAAAFPGWDAVRQELMSEGWILADV